MKKFCLFFLLCLMTILNAQDISIPTYYNKDENFSERLKEIITDLNLNKEFDVGEDGKESISLAVIDLTKDEPVIGGVNPENFIYPASVYKMYVAAEILEQISEGEYSLDRSYVAKTPNTVDRSREIKSDPRPLLKDGDTVTVNYLLDLMITRSDNSAANCLIDIATRPEINTLIQKNNWRGSEVTRKFLSRKFEDPGYDKVPGTMTSALHAADFMYKIYKNQLVNSWVSNQMKCLLGRQLDKSKLAQGLPRNAMFYHKTGWFSYWTNDVGIVEDENVRYIIACFLPVEEESALLKMKELSSRIYELMKSRK